MAAARSLRDRQFRIVEGDRHILRKIMSTIDAAGQIRNVFGCQLWTP
jgi:hypothetical protein